MELKERTELARFTVWSQHGTQKNEFLLFWSSNVPELRYSLKCIDTWSSSHNLVIATFEGYPTREEDMYRFILLNKRTDLEGYELAAVDEALEILNSDKDKSQIREENHC